MAREQRDALRDAMSAMDVVFMVLGICAGAFGVWWLWEHPEVFSQPLNAVRQWLGG